MTKVYYVFLICDYSNASIYAVLVMKGLKAEGRRIEGNEIFFLGRALDVTITADLCRSFHRSFSNVASRIPMLREETVERPST